MQYPGGQGYQTCVRAVSYHLCAYNFAAQGLVTREWLHFMVVFDEPEMTLYINGELNATRSAGPWSKGAHDLVLVDPTYGSWVELEPRLAEALPAALAPGGQLVVETSSRIEPVMPLDSVTSRRYGSARITIFTR